MREWHDLATVTHAQRIVRSGGHAPKTVISAHQAVDVARDHSRCHFHLRGRFIEDATTPSNAFREIIETATAWVVTLRIEAAYRIITGDCHSVQRHMGGVGVIDATPRGRRRVSSQRDVHGPQRSRVENPTAGASQLCCVFDYRAIYQPYRPRFRIPAPSEGSLKSSVFAILRAIVLPMMVSFAASPTKMPAPPLKPIPLARLLRMMERFITPVPPNQGDRSAEPRLQQLFSNVVRFYRVAAQLHSGSRPRPCLTPFPPRCSKPRSR